MDPRGVKECDCNVFQCARDLWKPDSLPGYSPSSCRRNGVDQDVLQLWPCQRAVVEKVGKKMKTAQQRIHSAKEDIDQYVISKVQFILKSTLKDVYERTGVFPKQCLKELP